MISNEPAASGVGLDSELRYLAASLAMPEADSQLVGVVMARLDREPPPAAHSRLRRVGEALGALRDWVRNRWRTVGVALTAVLVLLLAVSPAGAKVREWLGFGAVVIQQQEPVIQQQEPVTPGAGDGPAEPALTSVPGLTAGGRELSLDQALTQSSFPIGVPAALGNPDRVTMSADGRLVTMEWLASAIRLDQIDGALSPFFLKKFTDEVEFTIVAGQQALWLARPHPILVLNPDGSERAESARQSGPSLIWQNADVTLRLEGVDDQQSAVAIAQTMT